MSFSGVKFRRIACENIEELVKMSKVKSDIMEILKMHAPTFSFTRLDEKTFKFTLHTQNSILTHNFRLDEEIEMERRDGRKLQITYTLESDNVLRQVIRRGDGKVTHFRRVFREHGAEMTIYIEGTNVKAKIYYEIVE